MIQWFVEPEARVEQFDKLCEVQSDKASVEVCVFAVHLYVWGFCVCIVCVLTVSPDNFALRWHHQKAPLPGGRDGACREGIFLPIYKGEVV